jgi:transcriptional regulator with XRE-family HTH domain
VTERKFKLGGVVRHFRERIPGMSQSELAKIIGVDGSLINQIENLKVGLTEETLEEICDALDITPIDFMMKAWEVTDYGKRKHILKEKDKPSLLKSIKKFLKRLMILNTGSSFKEIQR